MRFRLSFPVLLLAPLPAACGDVHRPPGRDFCRKAREDTDWGEHHAVVSLPDPDLPDPVVVEVLWGEPPTLLASGAPVVVVLSGGFEARILPVEAGERAVDAGAGFVHLYVGFPDQGGEVRAPGLGDLRGRAARCAVRTALRYAAGALDDTDGCGLRERVGVTLAPLDPFLHGQSNGGNLAVAVLADPALDLPAMAGLTVFETPSGAQFSTLEIGSAGHPLPLYEEGACAWSAAAGITCEIDPGGLAWSPGPDDSGILYYDLDDDGAFSEDMDFAVHGLVPVVDGEPRLVVSPVLAAQVAETGLAVPGLLGAEEAWAFWAGRDAGRLAGPAMALHPDLPIVVIGTAEDHGLALPDHPHVTGLAEALQASGATWLRVNPDAAYAAWATGVEAAYADNPANTAVVTGGATVAMEVDEDVLGVQRTAWTTAALAELAHRTVTGRWEPDLEGTIGEGP